MPVIHEVPHASDAGDSTVIVSSLYIRTSRRNKQDHSTTLSGIAAFRASNVKEQPAWEMVENVVSICCIRTGLCMGRSGNA